MGQCQIIAVEGKLSQERLRRPICAGGEGGLDHLAEAQAVREKGAVTANIVKGANGGIEAPMKIIGVLSQGEAKVCLLQKSSRSGCAGNDTGFNLAGVSPRTT
jgi:hypothetical protein